MDAHDRVTETVRKVEAVETEISRLRALEAAGELSEGQLERLGNLVAGLPRLQAEHREARLDVVRDVYAAGAAIEVGFAEGPKNREDVDDNPFDRANRQHQDAALRTIDQHESFLSARAGDRLHGLVRSDKSGAEARYLAAVGDPQYEAAFENLLADPNGLRFLPERQREAVRKVRDCMFERAAMTATGGVSAAYAIPFALDPTVVNISDSQVNPLREIARVVTISGLTWKGVNSAGITASFDVEAAEVSEDTPTLTQPSVDVLMGRAFVPFSIESEDWPGLRAELTTEFQEAKDNLEATQFTLGTGAPQPQGIMVGATYLGTTAGSATLAIADVYTLQDALPARYQPNAKWMASGTILNKVRRLTGPGHTTEMPLFTDEGPAILRRRAYENSKMSTSTASAQKVLVYGDFSRFLIVDRIGMNVELVAHIMGGNQRPTGQRGLFAWWRTVSVVRDLNGLRVLKVL